MKIDYKDYYAEFLTLRVSGRIREDDFIVCKTCGAVIDPGFKELHIKYHEKRNEIKS